MLQVWPALRLALIGCIATYGITMPSANGEDHASTPTEVHAPTPDYEFIASTGAQDLDEMLLRDKIRPDTIALIRELDGKAGYAGAWVTWKPLRFHVSITDGASQDMQLAIQNFQHPELLVVHKALLDLQVLERDLSTLVHQRQISTMPKFDGMIDVQQNSLRLVVGNTSEKIVLDALRTAVVDDGGAKVETLDAAAEDSGIVQSPIIVDHSDITQPATMGGGALSNGCSSAFMIASTTNSYFGPLSAGHLTCDDNSTYPGGLRTDGQLPVVAGRRDSSFHRITNGGSVSNEIYISRSPYYRTITGSVSWGYTAGDQVCKNGKTTGFTCGTVTDIYVSPSYVDNSSRFIRFSSGCAKGDSGAPVFANNLAYGVLSGCSGSTSTIFGSITYAIPSGYYLYRY